MPQADEPAAPPAFGLADLEDIWEAPAFRDAPHDRRQRMLDSVIAGAFDEVTSAPDYTPETYQSFAKLAATSRQRLEGMHTLGEKAGETAGKAWTFLKSAAADIGTAALGLAEGAAASNAAAVPMQTPVLDSQRRGFFLGIENRADTLAVMQAKAAGMTRPLDGALDGLKADIDAGKAPLTDPKAFNRWLGGHSVAASAGQIQLWMTASAIDPRLYAEPRVTTGDEVRRFSLANDPDARALLVDYVRTQNPQSWQAFTDQVKKTPRRRENDAAGAAIVNGPGGRFMRETFGGGAEHLLTSADPVNVASYILPMARVARVAGAAEAATASFGSRALEAAKATVKGAPEQMAFGVEATLAANPHATADQMYQAAVDQLIGGTAIGAATFGAGEAARGVSAKKRPQTRSENGTSELPPESDAPPADTAPPVDTTPPVDTAPPVEPAPEPVDTRPPYRVLREAGLELDQAAAIHEAQGSRSVTDPESIRTLAEQFGLMNAQRKPGVFFDGVRPDELPPIFRPVEGDSLRVLPVGENSSVVFDTRQIDEATAAAKIQADELGDVLGYGIPRKPEAGDRVAVVRARDGHEVVSVVIDDATEAPVLEALQRMHEPGRGDTLTVEAVDQVLADRETYRRAEVASVSGEVAHWKAMETDNADFLAAAKAKAKRSFAAKKGAGLPPYPQADGDTGTAPRDVLDEIVDFGGIYLPPPGERRGGDSDYSKRIADAIPPRYMTIFSAKGEGADFVATQLGFERVDDMAEAVIAAVQNRINLRKQFAARAASERQVEKQAISFGKQALDPPDKVKEARQPIAASELNVGDVVEIAGERVKVREIDPDTMDVTLEDGAKFGVQRITDADVIYVEDYAPRTLGDSLEFLPPEDVAPEPLALETQTPDAVVADRAATEARAKSAADRQKLDDRAKAPLRGDSSDVGQGRLFAEDSDLLSGPSAEQLGGTASNIARASLPRGPLPAGQPAAVPSAGKPVSLTEIRQFLLDKVGLPAVGVRRFSQRALGIYKMRPEVIRLRAINDLPTLAHEIGHHLHGKLDPAASPLSPPTFGGRFDSELLVLGQTTSRPSYTRDMKRMEGVAEFTRLWLTEPQRALAAAPRFAQHFTASLPKEILAGLEAGRTMVQQYIHQPALVKLGAQVVFDAQPQGRSVGEILRAFYAKWVNTLQPMLDVVAAAERAGMRQAQRVRTWIENHRGGWQAKAFGDVMLEQSDLQGRRVGDSLKVILSDLKPDRVQDFSRYIAIKRAIEIEGSGKTSGFDFQGATGWQQQLPRWEREFEPVRQRLLAFQDNTVQLLADAGILSGQDVARMRKANRDYVPFFRLYEAAQGVTLGPKTGGQGVVNNGKGVRGLKGSDRAIVDPLQSVVKNAYFFRKLAENNHIGVQFFDMVGELQGGGRFADQIVVRRAPTRVPHDAVVAKLIDAGVIANEADLPGGVDLAFDLWKMVQNPDHANGEVIVRKGGKTQHWQVRDAALLTALRHSDTETISLARIFGPTVGKALAIPGRVLRWGATGHPFFALSNWTRDQLSAAVFSKTGFKPFWDGIRGAWHVLNKDATYREWVRSGGKFAGQATYDAGLRQSLEAALPKDRSGKAVFASMMRPATIKRALAVASEIMEEATRVQEFARARQQGIGALEAANLSKEVTLNFARAGEASRLVNQLIAFFNAGLQDMDKVVREHANPATRGRAVAKGLLYITVPSVLTWALGKDDPVIQDLPEWKRNLCWNVNLHPVAKALGRRGFVLSIPKPFLMGAIYGTTVERALDVITGRDPNGARKAVANIASNTLFRGDIIGSFSAIKPSLEVLTNYDFFKQGPVVPERLRKLPAEMQWDTSTSQFAKAIGKLTGRSPIVIDHLITGHFASAGKISVEGIDWAMTKAAGGEANEAPDRDLFEYAPFRSFAVSPYQRNVWTDRFYNGFEEAEGLLEAWRKQAPQLTKADQAAWWKKNGRLVEFYQQKVDDSTGLTRIGAVRKAARGLAEINAAMRTVRTDKTLSGAVKRERLLDLTDQYNQAAKASFELLHPETKRKVH